ncbi:MAG: ACT domain-containing protein [Phycisphaerae bacterium]
MAYKISTIAVWAGDVRNQPGMLARVLESLRNAGANLEFVVARRVTENTSRVFVSPLKGAKQSKAAADVGMSQTAGMHTVRIEGPDRAGLGADITRAIADAGINIRGMSSASIAKKCVCNIAFASLEDAKRAIKAIKRSLAKKR